MTAPMSYEDVTYALDAAGTQTVSVPSNDATPIIVVCPDGRELRVVGVDCQADKEWKLGVILHCE